MAIDKVLEHLLLASASALFAYFAWWTYKDIHREKRPEVTDDMLNDAYLHMIEENDFVFDD